MININKIIDYILDCDYKTQRGEIEYLLNKAFKDNNELYEVYSDLAGGCE